jgi:hypothetical protein
MRQADLLINQPISYKDQSAICAEAERLEICKHGGEAYVSFDLFQSACCVKSDMHAHDAKACKTGMGVGEPCWGHGSTCMCHGVLEFFLYIACGYIKLNIRTTMMMVVEFLFC